MDGAATSNLFSSLSPGTYRIAAAVLPGGNFFWWSLAALFFVGLMTPAKLFAGVAYGLAERREKPAWLSPRIACWPSAPPAT